MPPRRPLLASSPTNGELSPVAQELAGSPGPARLARLAWPGSLGPCCGRRWGSQAAFQRWGQHRPKARLGAGRCPPRFGVNTAAPCRAKPLRSPTHQVSEGARGRLRHREQSPLAEIARRSRVRTQALWRGAGRKAAPGTVQGRGDALARQAGPHRRLRAQLTKGLPLPYAPRTPAGGCSP